MAPRKKPGMILKRDHAFTEAIGKPGSRELNAFSMASADAKEKLEDSGYVFFDLRKTEDSSKTTIPGAQAWDMDAAKEGDAEAGKATMTKATQGLDKNIILVCYSGKRYAQATTNALSAIGYDMSKVYTLEGGFKAWSEKFPELCVAPEAAEATEEVTPVEIDTTIAFVGSSSLAPIIASLHPEDLKNPASINPISHKE